MIGIGKWTGKVNTIFFGGEVSLLIQDKNGAYDFALEFPGEMKKKLPEIVFKEIKEEGNTLNATAEIALLPGKTVEASLTFEGDVMNGILKIPFMGKISLENFKRNMTES